MIQTFYCCSVIVFFFFKQKTAYEMRISDWSSDVCSSDLADGNSRVTYRLEGAPHGIVGHLLFATGLLDKIGRGLETMVRHAGDFARGAAAMLFEYTPEPLGREQQERLAGLTRQIAASPYAHDLADRLAAHITTAQEVDLEIGRAHD